MSATKRLVLTCAVAVLAVGAFATTSEAQFRGRVRIVAPVIVGGGFYYDPFFYDPWYGYAGQWGPYYRPYGRYLLPDASVRLEVKPSEAEVYVDGYYAGIVDDFDGVFQRLHVPPGDHEIELYLQGYRTVRQKVYLTANNTFKVKYNMEKLGAGEQPAVRPEPINPPAASGGQPPYPPAQAPYPPQRGPGRRMAPPPPPPEGGSVRGQQAGYGSVSIRVQPADAEVSIDGEPWRSPAGQERLVVQLTEGSHTVEIRKSGFRTYVTQVDVRRGDTTQLNVSLRGEQ